MGDVIQFRGVTRLALDPDVVLENTKGELTGFIIAGYTKDGEYWFASTYADSGDSLWLAEMFKKNLLEVGNEE